MSYIGNILLDKSLDFAVRIVKLHDELRSIKEYSMSEQLLRSGTSIGANVSESISAESSIDFIHKLSIAQKEANETIFWIKLLSRTKYIPLETSSSLIKDCDEIRKIISSTILSTKKKIQNS